MNLLDYLGILIFTTMIVGYGVFCYIYAKVYESDEPRLSQRDERWVYIKVGVVGTLCWLVSTGWLCHQQHTIEVEEKGFKAAWLEHCQGDKTACNILYEQARKHFRT